MYFKQKVKETRMWEKGEHVLGVFCSVKAVSLLHLYTRAASMLSLVRYVDSLITPDTC